MSARPDGGGRDVFRKGLPRYFDSSYVESGEAVGPSDIVSLYSGITEADRELQATSEN